MSSIRVEVVLALPRGVDAVSLNLPAGSTVRDAVDASGLAERHPQLDLGVVGVFGRRVAPDARLADGDRVEVYRPLQNDPKEARRRRARGKLNKR
jgi:putative ubiquitin-RnfH superfamily antitoxin RatB of RatAB toxin-antitoxin module